MPHLLFRLNQVPEDEAAAVRGLLAAHEIEFYETSGGNWGFSVAGIWLRDAGRLKEARELIDAYQRERGADAREAYKRLQEQGKVETLLGRLRSHPLQMLFYFAALALVLYLSLAPFVLMLM